MCYKKPGPRCARHLQKRIISLKKKYSQGEISEDAFKSRNNELHFEFYGTATGQKKLTTQIEESSDEHQKNLITLKESARKEYLGKLSLLKVKESSVEEDEEYPSPSEPLSVDEFVKRECIRQHVGEDRMVTMRRGFDELRNSGMTKKEFFADPVKTTDYLKYLAGIIEPDNGGRFRITPVTFASGGGSANAHELPRLVYNLVAHGENLSTNEWVKEFVYYHPYSDGNGRMGAVLYNFLNGTMDKPRMMPYYFGKKNR